jgi:hypothetical protein
MTTSSPQQPSSSRNHRANDGGTVLAPMFKRFMRMRLLVGQQAPAPSLLVVLRYRGLRFVARSNARYLVALPQARPVVLPRPWLILMSLN